MRSSDSSDVAIIGMACVFPGARDLDTYWRNLLAGHDAISDAPAHRIDPVFFDAEASELDRLYCRRGGFVDDLAEFDALRWGLMPVAIKGSEPDQLLSLDAAAAALDDAGFAGRAPPRERTRIVLRRNGVPASEVEGPVGAWTLRLSSAPSVATDSSGAAVYGFRQESTPVGHSPKPEPPPARSRRTSRGTMARRTAVPYSRILANRTKVLGSMRNHGIAHSGVFRRT